MHVRIPDTRPILGTCKWCDGPIRGGIAVDDGFCCGTHKMRQFVLDHPELLILGGEEEGANEGQDEGQNRKGQISKPTRNVSAKCRDCGEMFPLPKQRGRPPVRCEPCRTTPKPTLTPEEKAKIKAVKQAISATKKKEHHCADCGKVIPPTGKRGRPAKRCKKCRG